MKEIPLQDSIVFDEPFVYCDKEYNRIDFDFSKVNGAMIISIQNQLRAEGVDGANIAANFSYLAEVAARTSGIKGEVIRALPYRLFDRVCAKVYRFLVFPSGFAPTPTPSENHA